MKKIMVILLIFAALSGGLLFLMKQRTRSGKKELAEYQQNLVSEYGENGVLHDVAQLEEVLNKVEKYIEENRKRLLIRSYERETDCVAVRFYGGLSLVLDLRLTGFD